MISILTPFTSSDQSRIVIWRWVREYYTRFFPDAEHVVGENYDVPFNKAAAVNAAAQHAHGDIFLLADADVLLEPEAVNCVTEMLMSGKAAWGFPASEVYRLTTTATVECLKRQPYIVNNISDDDCRWHSTDLKNLTGWLMVTRENWDELCGLDERFSEGWGCEDIAFIVALESLYGCGVLASGGKAVHFQHTANPGPNGTYRWPGQKHDYANKEMSHRYAIAAGNPAAIRALLDERKAAAPAS